MPKRTPKPRAAAEEAGEAPAAQEQTHADALLVALQSGASVPATVDAILQLYRDEDPNVGLAAIINAISKAAGVQGTAEVPASAIRDTTSISATLEELFARVPVDSGAYFLVNKDPKYKRIRKTFPEFFERLVQSAFAAGILFDGVLISTLYQWIVAMSGSKARSFRHTSTIAVLALITGLNEQINMVAEAIPTLKKKDAAAKQVEYNELVKLQEEFVVSVVHDRAKDIAAEIRLSVVQALRQWFLSSPEIYLCSKYLRYLSISLHDKKPELRTETLEILIHILGNRPADAARLREFLKHYANRLLEMVNDVETRVADLAIKVIALVVRADTDAGNTDDSNATFNNNMIDHLLMSLFDERAVIRASAGTFLKVFIRCRLSDDSEKTLRDRTELLCTFASIFRSVHREPNPEKYMVDALWRDDNPPSLLTNYAPILVLLAPNAELNDEESIENACVSLSFIAALLQRMKGPLTFGPSAKDDLKVPMGKVDAQRTDDTAALRIKLSKDAGLKLKGVLDRFKGTPAVIVGVAQVLAQLDFNAFTTSKESHSLAETIDAFRHSTATLHFPEENDVSIVADAWYSLAFTEHKLKTDAEKHLHELLKVVLKQPSAKGGSSEDAWARVRMLSRLVSLKNQWVVFFPALKQHANNLLSPITLKHLLVVSIQSVLWNLGEMAVDPSIKPDAVKEQISEVTELYLQIAKGSEDEYSSTTDEDPQQLAARVLAFGCLCDLMALPVAPHLSQLQEEALVECAFQLVDQHNELIKKDTDVIKSFGKQKGDVSEFSQLLQHRRRVTIAEAAVSQIVVGLVRLFTYESMDKKLSASALLLWTRVSVKAAADVFKTMFHNTRDQLKDSFQLERDILSAAYTQCSAQGSNAIALENLYQVGAKLSSMHFLLTDRYYPACVAIVRFGVNFATTVDTAMLQAISPYCSRLKQSDALDIANSLSLHSDIFAGQNVSPFARTFLGAIRRAARLEDPGGSVAPTGMSVPRGASKRPRENVSASAPRGAFEADDIFSEIVRSNKRPAPASKARVNAPSPTAPANRHVTKDGWRVAGSASGTPVASQQSQPSAYVPLTQGSVLSSLGDLDDEILIATQEYE